MTERTGRPWLNYLLGLLCVGAVVAAILVVGPASGSTTTVTRTAKAAEGVVQSTVSGSGNLQAASQLNLGFKTSGTVTNIYVTQGQHVTEGQLLATLDPQSAEVTLEQSKAALQSAEANLAKEEETDGETSTGSGGSGAAGASDGATASAASVDEPSDSTIATTAAVSASTTPSVTTDADSPGSTTTPTTTTAPAGSPHTTPSSTTTTPSAITTPATSTTPTTTSTEPNRTTSSKTVSPQSRGGESQSSGSSSKASESSTAAKTAVSTATRKANLASARAAVKSDQLTVQSDEEAVASTKLYAPETGTIVSLAGQVGEVVSASGTTRASSSSSSGSGSSGSGTSAAGGASTGRSTTGASSTSSSSDSSSSSSTSFAVLSDLSSMQLVVALSESEIGHVKVGQIATVTVEALESSKLAAHVSEVATLSTSSSGVVSYDVTFQLDQMESGLKPGMSATAEVVVKQAEGVNVPTTAISADSVTVVRNGKDVRQRVTTGLAGNTSTIVLSGLKAGETVVLPAATSTSSSTSLTSRLGSRLGGGAVGGGAALGGGGGGGFAGGGGGGGAAFFRGGG
jgi:multidrug efflux pump subunit AcrA (membrane-fusion protein)